MCCKFVNRILVSSLICSTPCGRSGENRSLFLVSCSWGSLFLTPVSNSRGICIDASTPLSIRCPGLLSIENEEHGQEPDVYLANIQCSCDFFCRMSQPFKGCDVRRASDGQYVFCICYGQYFFCPIGYAYAFQLKRFWFGTNCY